MQSIMKVDLNEFTSIDLLQKSMDLSYNDVKHN